MRATLETSRQARNVQGRSAYLLSHAADEGLGNDGHHSRLRAFISSPHSRFENWPPAQ